MVLTNSINSLVVPLLNVFISAIVINRYSATLWGEFVQIFIVVQFVVHLIAWGNKEYLLREFSRDPVSIPIQWQTSLSTRLVLVGVAASALLISGYQQPLAPLLILWGLSQVLYQSMESIIVYRKDFPFVVLVEVFSFLVMVIVLLFSTKNFTLNGLISLFASLTSIKALLLLFRHQRYTLPPFASPMRLSQLIDPRYYLLAFPFFLLSFSGMLNSRVDLYSVRFLLTPEELARYQVFINMLIYIQAVAAFILTPFIKHIYRMDRTSVQKISINLLRLGVFIAVPALVSINLVLTKLYNFQFSFHFFVLGFLFVIPIYYYLPIIYIMFRMNRQRLVLVANLTGIAINLLLNIILIPSLGLIGALLSTTVVRLIVLIFYHKQGKHLLMDKKFVVGSLG
jgi:O-antigen/teichoic acid export membrane protein